MSVLKSKLGYDANNPLIAFPTASGGDHSTGITDRYWSYTGVRVVRRGGAYNTTTGAGAFFFECDVGFTNTRVYVGCRLLKTA